MVGDEAQDVLLAAETSLSRRHNRRRSGRRPTTEAPHCVTCLCIDNRQMHCSQRCSSSRRHSARRNTTVDELLREMNFNTPSIMSGDDTYAKNQVEEDGNVESSSACPSRCARSSSYCEASKSPEATDRSCNGYHHLELDNTSQIRSTKSDNVEGSDRHSDGSKRKWTSSDSMNSRRLQQILGIGDRNSIPNEPAKAITDVDEEESSSETTIAEESHIRQLKLVRWQFIERIHDEISKLYSLQRHLDGCCSPPPLTRRRSVSTMTSAKLLADSNVSGQF